MLMKTPGFVIMQVIIYTFKYHRSFLLKDRIHPGPAVEQTINIMCKSFFFKRVYHAEVG